MIRSGRIRRLFRTRSLWEISPEPSVLESRVSNFTTWECFMESSAESSMVTIRSSEGMAAERALRSVVFPAPVPPEIKTPIRAATQAERNSTMGALNEPLSCNCGNCKRSVANRRMDNFGPSSARGGITAFTREPSGNRASTMGLASSTRRPTLDTTR